MIEYPTKFRGSESSDMLIMGSNNDIIKSTKRMLTSKDLSVVNVMLVMEIIRIPNEIILSLLGNLDPS